MTQRLSSLDTDVTAEIVQSSGYSLKRVINATGVVLHTNLGRSPLSQAALEHMVEVARGYSNLEFDLKSGERSRRDVHAERLLLRLLDLKSGSLKDKTARRAIVVNNCAAATVLASVSYTHLDVYKRQDGTLTDLKPFAQRGGESVAADGNGNVYVANGQVFVYSANGKQIAEIDVPERPLQLIFGGADRKTLFILAHHALFAARVR